MRVCDILLTLFLANQQENMCLQYIHTTRVFLFSFFFVMPRRLHKTRKTKRLRRRYGGENEKQKQQEKLADEIVALHRKHDDKDEEKFRQKMKAYLNNMSTDETVQQTMLRELNSKNKEGQSVDDMIAVIWKDKKTKFDEFMTWWEIAKLTAGAILPGGKLYVASKLADLIPRKFGYGKVKPTRLKKLTKKHAAKQ